MCSTQAGVPRDLFRTLLLPSSEVEALIKDDNIAAVTLTGSVAAGKSVATAAGSVLKKCVLELGGSDAYVVLEDADIEAAAKVAATARMVNGGQSCIAGKRFIVVRSILEPFEKALVDAMRDFEMGDPRKRAPSSGRCRAFRPATKSTARSPRHRARARGCCLAARSPTGPAPGIRRPSSPTSVAGQPAHDEEVFGPVAAIIAAEDEADAIRIANDSEFGLGSGVLTGDLDRGRRIAARRARSRHELRQRERPLGPAHALRRGQAFGLRPRMLAPMASASSPTSRPCT